MADGLKLIEGDTQKFNFLKKDNGNFLYLTG